MFDLADLRARDTKLDEILFHFEPSHNILERVDFRSDCDGVLVAHRSEWAAAIGGCGEGSVHCSLGRDCAGPARRHRAFVIPCDIAFPGGCPLCGPVADRLHEALFRLLGDWPSVRRSRTQPVYTGDEEPPNQTERTSVYFDLYELRALCPPLDAHLTLHEFDPAPYTWKDYPQVCPGVVVRHVGDWSRHLSAPHNFVTHCSQGSMCRGSHLWHPAGTASCAVAFWGGCLLCRSAVATEAAGVIRSLVEEAMGGRGPHPATPPVPLPRHWPPSPSAPIEERE